MPTISAVIIAKNEEVMLPRCLESVKGVDEIIVSDTGSTDKTVEVAKKYTDKVFFHPWEESFCKARNLAKSHATGDWILSIDCDEILHDFEKVKEAVLLAEQRGILAIDVLMIAEDETKQKFLFPRLFKNSTRCWWNGDIHNHLSVLGEKIGDVEITYGYSPAHHSDPDRAFRILKKSVERNTGPREIFYLGREYFYRKDYEQAVVHMGKYVQLSSNLSEKAEAFLTMARAYWAMKMPNDARDACAQSLIVNPHFKEAILFMAELAGEGSGNERWQHNADQWKKMAESADNTDVLFIRNV